MEFTGKVALITGGGGGIGRATALGFALRGAKVMVVDHDAESGKVTTDIVAQRGGDAKFTAADVTKSASVQDYVKATLDAYGRIDCFFNNAGIEGKVVPIQDYDEAVFDQVIAVNLKGVFLGMRYVLPEMLKQGSGTVVNTASVAGLFGGPGMPAYVASKHGVFGLTKVASADVAPHGIRVNAVCPGPVETRMMRSLKSQPSSSTLSTGLDPPCGATSADATLSGQVHVSRRSVSPDEPADRGHCCDTALLASHFRSASACQRTF